MWRALVAFAWLPQAGACDARNWTGTDGNKQCDFTADDSLRCASVVLTEGETNCETFCSNQQHAPLRCALQWDDWVGETCSLTDSRYLALLQLSAEEQRATCTQPFPSDQFGVPSSDAVCKCVPRGPSLPPQPRSNPPPLPPAAVDTADLSCANCFAHGPWLPPSIPSTGPCVSGGSVGGCVNQENTIDCSSSPTDFIRARSPCSGASPPPFPPSPPPPAPPPPLLPRSITVTGPCSLTDGGVCATSPNYPEPYNAWDGVDQECTISNVPAVSLEVRDFDVEMPYFYNGEPDCSSDHVIVNGERYCGSTGPSGAVAADGIIRWKADSGGLTSGGWLLCWPSPPSSPPMPPSPPSPPTPPPSLPPSTPPPSTPPPSSPPTLPPPSLPPPLPPPPSPPSPPAYPPYWAVVVGDGVASSGTPGGLAGGLAGGGVGFLIFFSTAGVLWCRRRSRALAEPSIRTRMRAVATRLEAEGHLQCGKADSRFASKPFELVYGRAATSVQGVSHYMRVSEAELQTTKMKGVAAIERELRAHGKESDIECLDYVLHAEAGSSQVTFQDGLKRDCDEHGQLHPDRQIGDGHGGVRGMTIDEFVAHPHARCAHLTKAHVVALRLYTTAAFRSINNPLRDQGRYQRGEPHPLPVTVALIAEALGKLRAVDAGKKALDKVELYRGMKDVKSPDDFMKEGGTELAPMSTTSDLTVAMRYSLSSNSVLLRLVTDAFISRGPDISFLSAFPVEAEYLFPPLTYLQPTGERETVEIKDLSYEVITVKPTLP